MQYLTASELVPPSSIISATHLLKNLDSFFTEQNPKAIAAAIAFGFCSVKKESKFFNKCVAEIIEDGGTNSEAVRYCNGGN